MPVCKRKFAQQKSQVTHEIAGALAFPDGPDDDPETFGNIQLTQNLAQAGTLFRIFDPSRLDWSNLLPGDRDGEFCFPAITALSTGQQNTASWFSGKRVSKGRPKKVVHRFRRLVATNHRGAPSRV